MKKHWVNLTDGSMALSIAGIVLAKITDNDVEVMGYQSYRIPPGPIELVQQFTERKVSEMALNIFTANIEEM